jgi:Acetyltransferase (GNAT) family
VWVSGFSIAPAFRSKSLASLLMREYLTLLKERSIVRSVQLEVISDNIRASKLYHRMGFRTNFELVDFQIKDIQALSSTEKAAVLNIAESDIPDMALPWLQHRTEYSWQRESSNLLTSCRGMKQFKVTNREGGLVVALAVEQSRTPHRIIGFAFEKESLTAPVLGAALRAALSSSTQSADIRLEPETSELNPLLEQMVGCERDKRYEEHNMVLQIDREEERPA